MPVVPFRPRRRPAPAKPPKVNLPPEAFLERRAAAITGLGRLAPGHVDLVARIIERLEPPPSPDDAA